MRLQIRQANTHLAFASMAIIFPYRPWISSVDRQLRTVMQESNSLDLISEIDKQLAAVVFIEITTIP